MITILHIFIPPIFAFAPKDKPSVVCMKGIMMKKNKILTNDARIVEMIMCPTQYDSECFSLFKEFFLINLFGKLTKKEIKNISDIKAKKASINNRGNCVVSFVKDEVLEINKNRRDIIKTKKDTISKNVLGLFCLSLFNT